MVTADFSAGEISSDGSVVLLEKLERKHGLLLNFGKLPMVHGREKQLNQWAFTMMQGYGHTNYANHLKNNSLYKDILEGDMVPQPIISRFENIMDKTLVFVMCYIWIDR